MIELICGGSDDFLEVVVTRIAIAACAAYPDLSRSNVALRNALANAGAAVDASPWNSSDQRKFFEADLILLRQTWDYMDDPGGFAAWAIGLKRSGLALSNAPELAIWNNDKRTLTALRQIGVATPTTVPVLSGEACRLREIETDRVVLKPAFGGSGVGVTLALRSEIDAALDRVQQAHPGRQWLAQEYLPEIADGEWKLICFDGAAQMAVHVTPRPGEFRVNSSFQPTNSVKPPPESATQTARAIADWLGEGALCFRVDGVLREGEFVVTELELTDPELFLHLADAAVVRRLAERIIAAV